MALATTCCWGPDAQPTLSVPTEPAGSQRTRRPIVMGTSVLALKYKDGVMMMSDMLGSYGGLARFKNVQRLHKVGESSLMGVGGDVSDMQSIIETLERIRRKEYCFDDGAKINAKEILSFLSRVMYNRRNKGNFLWNTIAVAGIVEGKAFLGQVDKLGMSLAEENFTTSGYGSHLALPLLREAWKPDMTAEEARTLLEKCMTVLYYRDCRTINKVQVASVTAENGVAISEAFALATKWDYEAFVRPKAGNDTGGSW